MDPRHLHSSGQIDPNRAVYVVGYATDRPQAPVTPVGVLVDGQHRFGGRAGRHVCFEQNWRQQQQGVGYGDLLVCHQLFDGLFQMTLLILSTVAALDGFDDAGEIRAMRVFHCMLHGSGRS